MTELKEVDKKDDDQQGIRPLQRSLDGVTPRARRNRGHSITFRAPASILSGAVAHMSDFRKLCRLGRVRLMRWCRSPPFR